MPNGLPGRGGSPGTNSGPGGPRPPDAPGQIPAQEEPEPSPEEIDAARTREITAKAMTGILVLLLKWLRISRKCTPSCSEIRGIPLTISFFFHVDVLKFEYLTQLLLDSNYVPLVLKLFAHQDVQQVVDSKMDRVENRYAAYTMLILCSVCVP